MVDKMKEQLKEEILLDYRKYMETATRDVKEAENRVVQVEVWLCQCIARRDSKQAELKLVEEMLGGHP